MSKPTWATAKMLVWEEDGLTEGEWYDFCDCVECEAKSRLLLFSSYKAKFEALIEKQIALVGGSESVFTMIHTGMINFTPDTFFIKEQCDLYRWRKEFIQMLKGNISHNCVFFEEEHIEYHITVNFEYMMAMWCTLNEKDILEELEGNNFVEDPGLEEVETYEEEEDYDCVVYDPHCVRPAQEDIEMVYDKKGILEFFEDNLTDNYDAFHDTLKEVQKYHIRKLGRFLDFSDYEDPKFCQNAHQIVEFHQSSPKTLLELSIKAVKKFNVSTSSEDIPITLQKKMQFGLYVPGDDPPDFISARGKQIFKKLNQCYLDLYKDPDLIFLRASFSDLEAKDEFQRLVDMYENMRDD